MLSWNEIRKRSIEFSKNWEAETRERAEAQSFWNDFFHIFGISRRRIAAFESPVKKLNNKQGFIDLFWKGILIAEHKSKGENLDKAFEQATDYFPGIKEEELPKYILVSDFERFRLYDLETNDLFEFYLKDIHQNIHLFGFIAGYQKKTYKEEDPVNIQAAELMGKLHDALFESRYHGHDLEVFLVRMLFCAFAEDAGIFERQLLTDYVEYHTAKDGSDLGLHLALIFDILNTPLEKRQKTLNELLNPFPYVNGKLFEERLRMPSFDSEMRDILLKCLYFDWSQISPSIFGSLFQSVMDQEKRKNLGAHYTSEKNILKLIKPLFLDELHDEFERIKDNRNRLKKFHDKLSSLRFLDPACGCGNFLVITYRELRLLELEILKILRKEGGFQLAVDVKYLSRLNVDQFFGIECEEFPVRIAEVALWLTDHQMNQQLSLEFGEDYSRLPLKTSATVIHGNSLQTDWEKIIPQNQLSYIMGNPPFVSKNERSRSQNQDMDTIFKGCKNYGLLDYVSAWFLKAADYIQGTKIKAAFVSTNSVSQGEQVGTLWQIIFEKNIKIHFAHRTFKWSNEARGVAKVYVIITGFACFNTEKKMLYDYETPKSEPMAIQVRNINPYLVDYDDIVIVNRRKPICNVPNVVMGNKPNDDGNFLFTDKEKEAFLQKEPDSERFFKPFVSAKEFLHNEKRWCLWLKDIKPHEIKNLPEVEKRIQNVKKMRLQSRKAATVKSADIPYLFTEIRQPDSDYLLIPRVSSEHRRYIPMAFFSKDNIVSDSCIALPNADLYLFGILTSEMHMTWMRHVCGRLKSDYRYSNKIVYNNFPFPKNPTQKQIKTVKEKAENILNVRKEYPEASLADLYDPVAMPANLIKAHQGLDNAVDRCYRKQNFENERRRIEFLFGLYKKYLPMGIDRRS